MLPGEVDGARFLRTLGRFGWHVARTKGSHRVLRNSTGRSVVIAFHKTLSRNSVQRALAQMGIPVEEFEAEL